MKIANKILTAVAAGAGYMAWKKLMERPALDLVGKVVLITGGSRGLGLATAHEFGVRGARVVICARDAADLERAREQASLHGLQLFTFVCDITDREQVAATVQAVRNLLGGIDILVNNAGVIRVGPFAEMDVIDFEDAMQVMFWGALHASMAVIPGMREKGQGSIVNITSIGGKVPVPHLLPYCCAKFAAVALSEGLRAELAPAGISVTTIAPGLMRTGSHLKAEFKGHSEREYAWFAAGAATPLISISARRAAREIVRATMRRENECVLSMPANIAARAYGLAPGISTELLTLVNRILPGRGGSQDPRSGQEMEATFNSRLWKSFTKSGKLAAESLNELPASL